MILSAHPVILSAAKDLSDAPRCDGEMFRCAQPATLSDTIADNASSCRMVIGGRCVAPDELDLRLCGMVLEKNGEVMSTAAGAAVLGDPANAVAWLANKLAEFDVTLEAGEVILPGALTAAALLGSTLKGQERLGLQLSGPGPMRSLFVDADAHGHIRGFVANVAGDRARVIPLIEAGSNPHNYTPRPDDLKRVLDMDVLVVGRHILLKDEQKQHVGEEARAKHLAQFQLD